VDIVSARAIIAKHLPQAEFADYWEIASACASSKRRRSQRIRSPGFGGAESGKLLWRIKAGIL
jgi:hypothetical protein